MTSLISSEHRCVLTYRTAFFDGTRPELLDLIQAWKAEKEVLSEALRKLAELEQLEAIPTAKQVTASATHMHSLMTEMIGLTGNSDMRTGKHS